MTNHLSHLQEASPSARPAWRRIVVAVLLACACPVALARSQPPAASAVANKDQLIAVDVVIDGTAVGRANLLQRNGVIFAQTDQLDRWGLNRRIDASAYVFEGANWYSLATVPRLEAVHYFRDQRLELQGGARKPVPRTAPAAASLPPGPVPLSTPQTVRIAPLSPSAASVPAARTDSKGEPRLIPLDVAINGSREGNWLLLEREGALYAPADAFDEWRIARKPDSTGFNYRGQTWFPLASVPGFEAQLNAANQSVDLKFLPGAFGATKLTTAPQEVISVTPPLNSFFLNYDLNQNFSNTRGVGTRYDLGALTEVGLSGEFGVLTSAHVGRNIAAGGPSSGGGATWRRLETTYTRDFPERNITLRVGDTATRAGSWGRSSYFGGIQLARNYSLTPGFITQPIPTITGQSSAPSTVELYINDALRQTSKVPTGPFAIDNFPLLTGSGQARVVVRDLLGRETVLVQNFFTHSDLLDKGLSDWSVDAGAVRRNIGLDNANYGAKFGSGLWRYGLSRTVTLETRGEAGKSLKGGGVGLSLALPGQMLGQIAVAGSDDRERGSGSQYVVGLEHASLRHGFTFRAEGATRDYRQFGLDGGIGYRTQLSASYTYASERFGHIGLGYARIDSFDHGPLTTYSANYSMRLGQRASLSFIATKVMGSLNADSVGMSLLIPLDAQINTTASAVSRDGKVDAYVSASKSMGIENGIAWRALAGSVGSDARGEGGLYYQGAKASASADVSVARDQRTARLGMQGGFVFVDKRFFASRRIQDSFALVEVPGYANVGVGFQSSVLTRTDESGRALVPRLLPYRRNSIRLDPGELPINAEIDSIEQIVVPGSRVGVKVTYPVRDGRGALLKIVLDDGEAAPAGAELKLIGDDREFFTARRGEAFVTGLKADNTLVLNHNGQSCKMAVQMPAGKADEIARIGPIVCSGVRR